jgi:hypothetical protein
MGLRPNMTWDELIEEIVRPEKYCTSIRSRGGGISAPGTVGGYICPTLSRELRRADKERQQKANYRKQIKKQAVESRIVIPEKKSKKSKIPENWEPRRRV